MCIVYKNYMDDTFSVDMFSPSMQKEYESAQMYFLALKNQPKNE